MDRINIYKDAESVAQAAADFLSTEIKTIVIASGICHIALPGGTTPARCLELLAEKQLPWEKIHCYLGDERCLPVADPERNDILIRDRLWSRVAIPHNNQHRIEAERGPEEAARLYAEIIHRLARLDIVVLGMGEDGHTASLFPDNPALADLRLVVPVYHAPKPPAERVSLGLNTLRAATLRVALVTGAGKREALAQVRAGAALPIAQLGTIVWFLDEAANS